MRLLTFIAVFTSMLFTSGTKLAYADAPGKRVVLQWIGLTGAGVIGAFDVLNRALAYSELKKQSFSCTTDECKDHTSIQSKLNTGGLIAAALPPVATIFFFALFGARKLQYIQMADRTYTKCILAASTISAIGGLGAAGTGIGNTEIAKQVGDDPAFELPPNIERYIASVIIMSVASLFAIGGTIGAMVSLDA